MNTKNKKIPRTIRAILLLTIIGILTYCCIIAYVCIQEGKVTKDISGIADYDAIIVLGAQVKPDGTPNVQLSWRLDKAIEAYERKTVPIVVCGAQGKDEPVTEAEAMKQYLTERNIPADMILQDPESFNTNENLENAREKLNAIDGVTIHRVLIVTSDYHVPRSLAIARDLGFEAEGVGSPCLRSYWIKNHTREALAWCKYWAKKYLHLPL